MTFATNGYVKVSVTDDEDSPDTTTSSVLQTLRNKPRVGKWRIGHSGVAFDIPVQISVSRKNRDNGSKVKEPKMTVLHYHADIHLNKFGERPRMFRGVITRDRYVKCAISIHLFHVGRVLLIPHYQSYTLFNSYSLPQAFIISASKLI